MQTSWIVVKAGGHWIALCANGRRYAGENPDESLKKRSAGLETPILMSGALPANLNKVSAWKYLLALVLNASAATANPDAYLL